MNIGAFSFGQASTNVAALMGGGSSPLDDALGVWLMEDYSATPTPMVRNSRSDVPVSQNLLRAPMRLYSNQSVWGNTAGTIVDGAADGPNGEPGGASSFVSDAGNFELYPVGEPTLAAGQFGVGIWAKRNTGTDQSFKIGFFGTGLYSPTCVATDTWQRFFFPASLGAGNQLPEIKSFDGVTGTNILVSWFTLYPGNVDLISSEPPLSGHMYLGNSISSRLPTYSSGALDFSNGPMAVAQLLEAQSVTATTAIVFAKKITSANTFNSFLSKAQHYQDFTAFVNESTYLDLFYAGASVSQALGHGTPPGWHMITNIYDGVRAQVWEDDVKVVDVAQTSAPVSIGDFFISLMNGMSGDYSFATMALFDRALTPEEVDRVYAEFSANLVKNSNTPALLDKVVFAEGDSITIGTLNDPYPNLYGTGNSAVATIADYASSGATIDTLIARAPFINGLVVPAEGRLNELTVLIGHNDLQGAGNVPTFLAKYAGYCDAARAAGYFVRVCTILTSVGDQFNIDRAICNATFLNEWIGVHCDAVTNFDTTPMGVDGNASNPTYFVDGTHPTEFGQTLLEALYETDVNGD